MARSLLRFALPAALLALAWLGQILPRSLEPGRC
jgi:hypothetical protein